MEEKRSSINISRDFKGIWIPREIWKNKEIRTHIECIVNCFYFQKSLDSGLGKLLMRFGYSKKSFDRPHDIKNFLCKKRNQSYPKSRLKLHACSWCDTTTYALHSHHYPIPSKHGGKEIVNICGTCHAEYHFLENSYEFSEKLIQLFKSCEGGEV